MAEDLEKALFEMRASPHEPRKLLVSLFPKGPSRSGEVQLPFTPSPASGADGHGTPSRAAGRASSSKITRPMPEGPLEIDLGDLAASGPVVASRRRRGRRKWLALGALGGAVVAMVVLAQSPRKGPQQEVTVAPAAAQSVPAPAAVRQNRRRRAPAAKAAVVEISLDSSPQDAQVIREDSGEVVGRTPLTITLPLGRDVVSFRFEKPGFAPASYKVIPDLAKSVRAELTAEPTRGPEARGRFAAAPPGAAALATRRRRTRRDPAAARREHARRRAGARLPAVGRLLPLGRSLDRRQGHRPADAGRALPGLLRRPQARAQAARPQGRSRRAGHGGPRPRAQAALRARRRLRRVISARARRQSGAVRARAVRAGTRRRRSGRR